MIQQNGLSPRAAKGHRRTRSATTKEDMSNGGNSGSNKSTTPTPSTQHGRFFNDLIPSSSRPAPGSTLPSLGTSTSTFSVSSPAASCKGHPKEHGMKQSVAFRLAAMMATAFVVLLCTRVATAGPSHYSGEATSLRAAASADVQDRCAGRIESRRGLGAPRAREQCAAVLPASVVQSDGAQSWLVSVHVDRAPSAGMDPKRLRGAAPLHRSLPHQYYVRAMEAALHSIATADPGASVDVAIFSEGRWGGIVDEMGVPLDWDVPGDVCEDLGLHCTQNVVLLNDASFSMAESLECIAASDVLVASESKFSRAAAVLSNHVKVLTDRWDVDEDEMMVALNPATTIAGMPAPQRQLLRTLVAEYHECAPSNSE